MSSPAISSSRPWPSTSMPIGGDRCPKLRPGQPEGDQQDVLHTGVERRGHLAEHLAGDPVSSVTEDRPAVAKVSRSG